MTNDSTSAMMSVHFSPREGNSLAFKIFWSGQGSGGSDEHDGKRDDLSLIHI